eukprot:TRINITY_DN31296_c0_g1_i1.p1 TRINITY_DN31296_c0_g1~~TRINITY_DN31296_c0_g1_i1.p1  ORF type:complete len:566 (+),score=139.00 TRINITY_DN31296_c0_g1_i1:79-1776(+)
MGDPGAGRGQAAGGAAFGGMVELAMQLGLSVPRTPCSAAGSAAVSSRRSLSPDSRPRGMTLPPPRTAESSSPRRPALRTASSGSPFQRTAALLAEAGLPPLPDSLCPPAKPDAESPRRSPPRRPPAPQPPQPSQPPQPPAPPTEQAPAAAAAAPPAAPAAAPSRPAAPPGGLDFLRIPSPSAGRCASSPATSPASQCSKGRRAAPAQRPGRGPDAASRRTGSAPCPLPRGPRRHCDTSPARAPGCRSAASSPVSGPWRSERAALRDEVQRNEGLLQGHARRLQELERALADPAQPPASPPPPLAASPSGSAARPPAGGSPMATALSRSGSGSAAPAQHTAPESAEGQRVQQSPGGHAPESTAHHDGGDGTPLDVVRLPSPAPQAAGAPVSEAERRRCEERLALTYEGRIAEAELAATRLRAQLTDAEEEARRESARADSLQRQLAAERQRWAAERAELQQRAERASAEGEEVRMLRRELAAAVAALRQQNTAAPQYGPQAAHAYGAHPAPCPAATGPRQAPAPRCGAAPLTPADAARCLFGAPAPRCPRPQPPDPPPGRQQQRWA